MYTRKKPLNEEGIERYAGSEVEAFYVSRSAQKKFK